MNQKEFFQTQAPSIQSFIQPVFCIIPRWQESSPSSERRNFDARGFEEIEATAMVGSADVQGNDATLNTTITAVAIAEFLSLSRQYLRLEI